MNLHSVCTWTGMRMALHTGVVFHVHSRPWARDAARARPTVKGAELASRLNGRRSGSRHRRRIAELIVREFRKFVEADVAADWPRNNKPGGEKACSE